MPHKQPIINQYLVGDVQPNHGPTHASFSGDWVFECLVCGLTHPRLLLLMNAMMGAFVVWMADEGGWGGRLR